jgi:hypothetical protein
VAVSKLDEKLTLRGKHFLITQSSLRLLAGSEINTLELAEYLQQAGASVLVYTYFLSDPIAHFFHKSRIKVVTDDSKLKLQDFDYVWVHHQVVPISFVKQLAIGRAAKKPAFIFLHMSGLASHYLEQAHVWELEQRIASKVLFVSDEAQENVNQVSLDLSKLDTGLYRNPAPQKFAAIQHTPAKTVKKILIVSNHPAEEVLRAAENLRAQGITVVSSGENQEEYKLIDPDYLHEFDVVVTIGKTVQYSLTANVPVYVYDIWGGPGYLNESNESLTARNNYSGRGFSKKTSHEIAAEIVNDYPTVASYQTKNYRHFVNEMSIDTVVPKIIKQVKPRQIEPFSNHYMQYLIGILTMLKYKFYHENLLVHRDEEIRILHLEVTEKDRIIDIQNQEIVKANRIVKVIYNSWTYKVGTFIVGPFRVSRRYLRRIKSS